MKEEYGLYELTYDRDNYRYVESFKVVKGILYDDFQTLVSIGDDEMLRLEEIQVRGMNASYLSDVCEQDDKIFINLHNYLIKYLNRRKSLIEDRLRLL